MHTNLIDAKKLAEMLAVIDLTNRGVIEENKDKKPYKYSIQNPDLIDFADINLITPEQLEEHYCLREVS